MILYTLRTNLNKFFKKICEVKKVDEETEFTHRKTKEKKLNKMSMKISKIQRFFRL